MTAAMTVQIRRVELFERAVVLRLPFRFGAATVTHCPQAFVRLTAEIGGRTLIGAAAELMVPKWFDKSPDLSHEQNFEQLREALRCARDALLGGRGSPWLLAQDAGETATAMAQSRGLPRLAAQFGPALLDKAVADAALQAAGLSWCDGVVAGVLGDPHSARAGLQRPTSVWLRHTVGLADRLTESDPGTDPGDGLPATLAGAIDRYGLRRFKLKLCGRTDDDLARLARIAAVLQGAGDYRATLDGNESFADAPALADFWRRLRAEPGLAELHRRTALLEQPLARAITLRTPIHGLGIDVPVILDESDDHDEALDEGLALGYRGISSKACKGIYRSLRNAARLHGQPGLLLSGEDLTCQAGLAVQQDTLLAASLGVADIERNGHHYVDGFGSAPAAEAQAFASAHPGLYDSAGGRVHLRVAGGQLDLTSLHGPGFAHGAEPLWADLTPMN
ncbi:MAG: hypothetical protein Q8N44_04795 [Rubrivivax sp.]|nr:hypothetical protein [Rubrivivax sp.]